MSQTIWGTFNGALTQYIRPYIEVSWTQNQTNNTSTVTATLYFHRYTNNYWSYNELTNSNGHSCTFRVGSSTVTQIRPFNLQRSNPPNRVAVWTRTQTITHNSDGTASVNISANGDTNVNPRTYSFGETITLPTIARETTITSVSISSNPKPHTANSLTVSLSRKHSSYSHRFEILDGSTSLFSTTGNLVTSINLTSEDVNKLINTMPTVTSKDFTFRVTTLSGSTVIGRQTKDFTVTLDHNSTKPQVDYRQARVLGNRIDGTHQIFVQTKSTAELEFTVNQGYGTKTSDLSMRVEVGGQPVDFEWVLNMYKAYTRTLMQAGTIPIKITATNSRGQVGTDTGEITVEPYKPPTITMFHAERSETNSTNVIVTRRYTRTEIGPANIGGYNKINAKIERRLSTGTTWTEVNTSTVLNIAPTITGNNAARSYVFRATITDSLGGTGTSETSVGTAKVLMEKYKDAGISVGQRFDASNPAIFQVGGDISLRDETGFTTNLLNHNFQKANLQNNWTHSSTNLYGEVGYYKIGGIVYLTGLVGGGTDMANNMFILPEGFRPPVMYRFLVATSAGEYEQLNVLSGGAVNKASSRNSTISWVSLAGVSFPVGG